MLGRLQSPVKTVVFSDNVFVWYVVEVLPGTFAIWQDIWSYISSQLSVVTVLIFFWGLREIAANKTLLLDAVASRPFLREIILGEANFILVRAERADELLSFCARRGVILRGFPGEPLLRDYIRISVGSAGDIEALEAVLDEWESEA